MRVRRSGILMRSPGLHRVRRTRYAPADTAVFTGILDTVSGIVVAYSERRLAGVYTGSLSRTRESGGNTELDIGYLANGDLDIAAQDAHCGANDGFKVRKYDQSGNGYNMIQATALKQPKVVSAGSTLVDANGNPFSQFDGTDDSMQAASVALDTYQSLYLVGKFTTAKAFFIEHTSNAANVDGFWWRGTDGNAWRFERSNDTHTAPGLESWMGSALGQVTLIYGGTGAYYLNGSVQPNTGESGSDVGDSQVTDALNLLSRNQVAIFSDGDFYELLIFDGAHDDATRQLIEADQKAKYSTP